MKSSSADPHWRTLTHHFFQTFFRLGFLDEAGQESFKRAVLGLVAVLAALGLLLSRIYLTKYAQLANEPTSDAYRAALPADQLLLICLPMLAAALATALIAHSLFPDENDFRILMILPVSRATVFGAKLAALTMFAGIFVVGVNLGFGVPFSLVTGGSWAEHLWPRRALAQLAPAAAGSLFAVAAVVAIPGLVLVMVPRRWLRPVSIAAQNAFICGIVLLLPLVNRIPSLSEFLAAEPRTLLLAPPAWFFGIERMMLGSRRASDASLALMAVAGMAIVTAVCAVCYLLLYRRFDQLSLAPRPRRPPAFWNVPLAKPWRRHPAREAVHGLITSTLRRSGLHQLVTVGAFSAGVALAINGMMNSIGWGQRWMAVAAFQAPLTMIAAAVVGLRISFVLPIELRAAWIFRITEQAESRRHALDAVPATMFAFGVVGPAIVAFPVEAGILGWRSALMCFPVVLLLGAIFVEGALGHLRRIPFTCTLLFGKRPMALTFAIALIAFSLFSVLGSLLLQMVSSGRVGPWAAVVGVLTAILVALRSYRGVNWGRLPLEFEDYLPDAHDTLQLRP